MSTLPYQGRCAFASLHPSVTFGFFAGAIVLSVVLANPICQAISVLLAAVCYLTFRGREAWRFIGGLAVVLLVVTLSAPLFNTQGRPALYAGSAGFGCLYGAYARGYDAVVRLLSPSYDLG